MGFYKDYIPLFPTDHQHLARRSRADAAKANYLPSHCGNVFELFDPQRFDTTSGAQGLRMNAHAVCAAILIMFAMTGFLAAITMFSYRCYHVCCKVRLLSSRSMRALRCSYYHPMSQKHEMSLMLCMLLAAGNRNRRICLCLTVIYSTLLRLLAAERELRIARRSE